MFAARTVDGYRITARRRRLKAHYPRGSRLGLRHYSIAMQTQRYVLVRSPLQINNQLFRNTKNVLAIDFKLLDDLLGDGFRLHISGDCDRTKQHQKRAQPNSEYLQH